jgi:hypothetical protein
MVRNVLGSVLAVVGAVAAVWSPFRAWYDGRQGRYYGLGDLFTGAGVTDARAHLFLSLFLPFAVAALITLVGLVLRERLLVALAGVIVLGFAVLWTVRVGLAEGSLTVTGEDANGLGVGTALAFGGGVLLLIAAAVMRGRRRRRGRRRAPASPVEPEEPAAPTLGRP